MLNNTNIVKSSLDHLNTGIVQYNDLSGAWYKEGRLHREDGPAVISFAKKQMKYNYYIDGEEISKENYEKITNASRVEILIPYLDSSSPGEKYIAEKRKDILNKSTKYTLHTKDQVYYNAPAEFYRELQLKHLLHNISGPAATSQFGGQFWYKDGYAHRDSGPACESINGLQEWFKNGLRHRDDGPAEIHLTCHAWYIEGKLHRESGPAVMDLDNSYEAWYNCDKLHREDGPAIKELEDGKECLYWYICGENMLEEIFKTIVTADSIEQLATYLISPSPGERYLAEKQMIRIKGKQND